MIPNYELTAFIRAGGFGDVWLARERVTGVRRAVKIVYKDDRARAARDIAGVKRYQACSHNHPNLLQILTVGETDRCYYYVMEAADNDLEHADSVARRTADSHSHRESSAASKSKAGPRSGATRPYEPLTLRRSLARAGSFDGRAALGITAKLIAGVSCLHRQELAHYDLKPENVLIVDREPRIADVGLVAPLNEGVARAGTPAYVSPGGHSDDLYAIGKILYQLISGRPAGEFPHLPPEMVKETSPELTASIEIVNRACHPRPERRFQTVDDLDRAVRAALHSRKKLWSWRRLSRRGKVTTLSALAVVLIGSTASVPWLYSRFIPVERDVDRTNLAADDAFSLVQPFAPEQDGSALRPYLRFDGLAKPVQPGRYTRPLRYPIENFLVELHLRFVRPWGMLEFSVGHEAAGNGGVFVNFTGQPGGQGLRIELAPRDASGGDLAFSDPIFGHPQPGLEYAVSVVRCQRTYVVAVWPLAMPSAMPIVQEVDLPSDALPARFITLECSTEDTRASAELLSMRVASYSIPVEPPDIPLPEVLRRGLVPAHVPRLPTTRGFPSTDLLAAPFHPYDSDAWMSMGNWSWWSKRAPGDKPKVVRPVPFSSDERDLYRFDGTYAGYQMLRFDRAVYGDFEARAHIKLAVPGEPGTEPFDPFVTRSHAGSVGLAFRLQDRAPAGYAWGGFYIASLGVDPGDEIESFATVSRFDGLQVRSSDQLSQSVLAPPVPTLANERIPVMREELFAPQGFTLTVRAQGANIKLFLNNRLVVDVEDPNPSPFEEGRLALYVSRLIATFESLYVTPLDAE